MHEDDEIEDEEEGIDYGSLLDTPLEERSDEGGIPTCFPWANPESLYWKRGEDEPYGDDDEEDEDEEDNGDGVCV